MHVYGVANFKLKPKRKKKTTKEIKGKSEKSTNRVYEKLFQSRKRWVEMENLKRKEKDRREKGKNEQGSQEFASWDYISISGDQ